MYYYVHTLTPTLVMTLSPSPQAAHGTGYTGSMLVQRTVILAQCRANYTCLMRFPANMRRLRYHVV